MKIFLWIYGDSFEKGCAWWVFLQINIIWINPSKIYVQSKKVNKCNPELTCLFVIMHMHKKELLKIDDVQDKDSWREEILEQYGATVI